jgi:hypothetical protein
MTEEQKTAVVREDPRFEHPKVLTIDLDEAAVVTIRAGGFNVSAGTLGTPTRLARSEQWVPVEIDAHLPELTETEIVVADLAGPEPVEGELRSEEPIGTAIWQQLSSGVLEPRGRAAASAGLLLKRSHDHGGAFVLFADPVEDPGYRSAAWHEINYADTLPWSNWSLLPGLRESLEIERDWGAEITVVERSVPAITAAIESGARFTCTIEPIPEIAERWFTIATNKWGKPVAGIFVPEEGKGPVVILPRIVDKGKVVRALLEDFLPSLVRNLFPQDERRAWIEEERYAPIGEVALRERITTVKAEAEKEVAELEAEVAGLRETDAHLRALLTETGTPLVEAVQVTLAGLGIEARDVDAEDGPVEGRLHEDRERPWQPAGAGRGEGDRRHAERRRSARSAAQRASADA